LPAAIRVYYVRNILVAQLCKALLGSCLTLDGVSALVLIVVFIVLVEVLSHKRKRRVVVGARRVL